MTSAGSGGAVLGLEDVETLISATVNRISPGSSGGRVLLPVAGVGLGQALQEPAGVGRCAKQVRGLLKRVVVSARHQDGLEVE